MRIVDPHHHLWDRDLHLYPWLAAPTVSGLVGDTTPLCRNYLLPDLEADAAPFELVKSVHLQAEIAH
ncbi:MAG: amidohydrolase, partial [Geminicoccaceae bacterium]